MKTLTLRKIIAAIKKAKKQDQIPWGVGSFYNEKGNNHHPLRIEGSSCAVGLALRGLGYEVPNDPISTEDFFRKGWRLADKIYDATRIDITRINDTSNSYMEMIINLEEAAKPNLDKELEWID